MKPIYGFLDENQVKSIFSTIQQYKQYDIFIEEKFYSGGKQVPVNDIINDNYDYLSLKFNITSVPQLYIEIHLSLVNKKTNEMIQTRFFQGQFLKHTFNLHDKNEIEKNIKKWLDKHVHYYFHMQSLENPLEQFYINDMNIDEPLDNNRMELLEIKLKEIQNNLSKKYTFQSFQLEDFEKIINEALKKANK